jgi:hypothetical protein
LESAQTWAALIMALAQLQSESADSQAAIITLAHHATATNSPSELLGSLNLCRVCWTHDRSKIKIQIWTGQPLAAMTAAIRTICIGLGGECQYGSPPRSAKERQAARTFAAAGMM